MKSHFLLLLLLSILITTGCRQPKNPVTDTDSDFENVGNEIPEVPKIIIHLSKELDSEEDSFLISNLELLGKIWGFLKYHHPEVGKGKYDWDDELLQFLSEYLDQKNLIKEN